MGVREKIKLVGKLAGKGRRGRGWENRDETEGKLGDTSGKIGTGNGGQGKEKTEDEKQV